MPKIARYRAKRPVENGSSSAPDGDSPVPERAAAILHVDMDAFYVSVELLDRPELCGKPVVVGGRADQRGVVAAASYEARRYGIQSAMPLRTAARRCPHAVFLPGRHSLYAEWSDRVAAVLAEFSPLVEMVSIDEAYLDLAGTGRLFGPSIAAAHQLHRAIQQRTGLPCSIGLAATRLVAKVASDQAKPRGLLWVPAGSEAAFLAPLPVRKIPGIGRVTEAALASLGIHTVGQLAALQQAELEGSFGLWGTALHRKARGQDAFEFLVDAEPKSISHNHTFSEDTDNPDELRSMLSLLCQKVAKRLREAGLFARTVTLTMRFANFRTITRSRTLMEPTDLDSTVQTTARALLEANWDRKEKLRLLGVAISSFATAPAQLNLLDCAERERRERLARATDRLRDRFGFSKIQFGGSLRGDED